MSYAEKHHRLWTDTPNLCKDYAGVLRENVNRLKCKGDETPAGEKAPFIIRFYVEKVPFTNQWCCS